MTHSHQVVVCFDISQSLKDVLMKALDILQPVDASKLAAALNPLEQKTSDLKDSVKTNTQA